MKKKNIDFQIIHTDPYPPYLSPESRTRSHSHVHRRKSEVIIWNLLNVEQTTHLEIFFLY